MKLVQFCCHFLANMLMVLPLWLSTSLSMGNALTLKHRRKFKNDGHLRDVINIFVELKYSIPSLQMVSIKFHLRRNYSSHFEKCPSWAKNFDMYVILLKEKSLQPATNLWIATKTWQLKQIIWKTKQQKIQKPETLVQLSLNWGEKRNRKWIGIYLFN